MAKSGGVSEGDRTAAGVKVAELKKELQKLLKAIVDEDDVNLEKVDRAHNMLLSLKDLKLQRTVDLKLRQQEAVRAAAPEEFKCPLSKDLMRDPVILSTGQTYERAFIQNWLKSGKRTCPQTQQVLSFTTLTPNHLIRDMIAKWCKSNGIKLPESKYNDDEAWSMATKEHFTSLLDKMSSTLPEQKQAARDLRLLTKRTPSTRALFSEFGDAVKRLIAPLCQSSRSNTVVDQELKEDIITTVLNISIHDNNKQLVAETPMVIPMLVDAVGSGTIQIRSNAAAALFTLGALDSNKALIGKSDALKPLIELLDEGHSLGMKDAACAIFNLCILHENKVRAVRCGAVEVIMKKIKERMQVDELLSILALLSTNHMAVEQMIDLSAVTCLLSVMKDTSDAKKKENCIAILYTLCTSDQATWKELREEEETHHTISQVAKDGNSRARRKAEGILERLSRAVLSTHSA